MTLSEAARTGRWFRRASEPDYWYRLDGVEIVMFRRDDIGQVLSININAEQLVATDWEPEPRKVEISGQDLLICARSIAQNNQIVHQRRLSPVEMAKLFIEELGLDEH